MLIRQEMMTFLAVVEVGSASGAAKRLYCSQPAVTAQLQRLERGLGVQLFERRDGQTFLLTDAGHALVTYGRMALQMQRLVEAHVAAPLPRRAVPEQTAGSPAPSGTTRHVPAPTTTTRRNP